MYYLRTSSHLIRFKPIFSLILIPILVVPIRLITLIPATHLDEVGRPGKELNEVEKGGRRWMMIVRSEQILTHQLKSAKITAAFHFFTLNVNANVNVNKLVCWFEKHLISRFVGFQLVR